jgi:hypothetical protein
MGQLVCVKQQFDAAGTKTVSFPPANDAAVVMM